MSSRSTSPDPITSSTLPTRRLAKSTRRSATKPLATRADNVSPSPAKSVVMDTGRSGDASPWRIKVTVQAEPKDGSSPVRERTRTIVVPLKGGSSSPSKRRSPAKRPGTPAEKVGPVKRPQRKRKGTPIGRSSRELVEDTDAMIGDGGGAPDPQERMSSPSKRLSRRSSTSRAMQAPTERTMRLGRAREELDHAIEAAVGYSGRTAHGGNLSESGDMTIANEDFTMVSVETLETLKNNTSMVEDTQLGNAEKSALSVSYLPSSPPRAQKDQAAQISGLVQYPLLSSQMDGARDTPIEDTSYDAMSWKPTGPAKIVPTLSRTRDDHSSMQDDEPSEWKRQRAAVSREIDNANTSQVIVIGDGTEVAPRQIADDDDIWAEEASRSLEEEEDQIEPIANNDHERVVNHEKLPSPQLHDLFGDLPLKPPRSKIPRTWRRRSGADFSYSDSPAHDAPSVRQPANVSKDRENRPRSRRGNASDEDGRRSRSSGVLTPPSTDEDVSRTSRRGKSSGKGELLGPVQGTLSTTHQRATGGETTNPARREGEISSLDSGSRLSADGDDTGLFWQMDLPNVFQKDRPRPQRKRAMDLSELLAQDKRSSPAKSSWDVAPTTAARQQSRRGVIESSTAQHNTATSRNSTEANLVDSHLRKSLLKSSKIGRGLLTGTPMQFHTHLSAARGRVYGNDFSSFVDHTQTEEFDSFESKASDQRQLLLESAVAAKESDLRTEILLDPTDIGDGEAFSDSGREELSEEDEATHLQSYEERLNIESPQKIQVNFNDSEGNSSLLAPKREYAPLFDADAPPTKLPTSGSQGAMPSASEKRASNSSQSSLLSRLGNTLWSAVVRPTGPTSIMPLSVPARPDPEFRPSLRAKLRSRYGVLADTHPWTMAHMRTLHRMLNSRLTNSQHSIVPSDNDPLPAYLASLIGARQSAVTDFTFEFTALHAQVVNAFIQIIVPAHIVAAMDSGEVEFLGDEFARRLRGMFGRRHGGSAAFEEVDMVVKGSPGSSITMGFVARAIGNVVFANAWGKAKQGDVREDGDSDDGEMDFVR